MSKTSENKSVVSLIKTAQEQYAEKQKEVLKQDKENKERIISLTEKEGELKGKIEADKKRVDEMGDEYDQLTEEKEQENLEAIKEEEFTKKDVSDGKISVTAFLAKGKGDDEVAEMTREKTLEELEKISDLIRAKGVEVIKSEIELYKTQNAIYGLTINPARILQRSYKDLADMLDYQIGPVVGHSNIAQSNQKQAEEELMIAEKGISPSNGFIWRGITLKQARRLIHDPKFPREHIQSLLSELDDCEPGFLVTVTYYFKHSPQGESVIVRQELEIDETKERKNE